MSAATRAFAAAAFAFASVAADARADLQRVPAAPTAIPRVAKALPGFALERHDERGEDGEHWSMVRADDGGRRCVRHVPPSQPLAPRTLSDRAVMGPHDPVALVRTELFRVDERRNAHLERVDFWFDPKTLGTREIERSTVALGPVATHTSGLMAYAFREGDAWHLVVPVYGRATLEDDQGTGVTTSCGHAHVVVDAAAVGGGTTATLAAGVPPLYVPNGTMRLIASASRTSRDPWPVLRAHLLVTGPDGADASVAGDAEVALGDVVD